MLTNKIKEAYHKLLENSYMHTTAHSIKCWVKILLHREKGEKLEAVHTCGILSNRRNFDSMFLLKKVLWEEVLLTCEHHIVLEPERCAFQFGAALTVRGVQSDDETRVVVARSRLQGLDVLLLRLAGEVAHERVLVVLQSVSLAN